MTLPAHVCSHSVGEEAVNHSSEPENSAGGTRSAWSTQHADASVLLRQRQHHRDGVIEALVGRRQAKQCRRELRIQEQGAQRRPLVGLQRPQQEGIARLQFPKVLIASL